MANAYSYDPTKLNENGLDRMRFELGDTTFAPGELTAALCDEEYIAIIGMTKDWRRAKIKCLNAILMKFSHQVNMSVDGLSYSFADRVKFWKELLDEEKRELAAGVAPSVNPASLGEPNGGHYFYTDMQKNPRAEYPEARR